MTTQAISSTARTTKNSPIMTLLVFKVDDQLYGLSVNNVIRIIEMVTITPLPSFPETIKGIINLQGRIVPVIDLRHHFERPTCSYNLHTPIILVDLINRDFILGLVVDTVEDVFEVCGDDLELRETRALPQGAAQAANPADYLAGVAKVDRRLIPVLEVQNLLSPLVQDQLSQALGMKVGR